MQPPNVLSVNRGGIPDELQARSQWVAWKFVFNPERQKPWTKVPVDPHTGHEASVSDPNTWGSIDEALQRMDADGLDGIGFVFAADDPYVGVDVDDAYTEKGLTPKARDTHDRLDTYAELSPTGTGHHYILKCADPPRKGRRREGLEAYSERHFFTVTGRPLPGRDVINDCTQPYLSWHMEHFGETKTRATRQVAQPLAPTLPSHLSVADEALLEACRRRWPRFSQLYHDGDLRAYGGDHSSADLALLTYFYRAGVSSSEELEHLFDTSALNRDKWRERPDYRERTIAAARNGAVPQDFSEVNDPAQLRRRITDLEAQVRATENWLVINSALLSQHSQIRGNRGLPQARVAQTLLTTFRFLESKDAVPPYRIWIKDVAQASGVHRNTAGRHINKFKEAGLLRVKHVTERRPPNLETGEILPPQTVTYLEPVGGARTFAVKLATADLRPKRGEEHPGAGPTYI